MSPVVTRRRALLGSAAAAIGIGVPAAVVVAVQAAPALSNHDRQLGIMADVVRTLQARADHHADGAGSDPADPYTQAVAEIDLVGASMAGIPADTLAGVLAKLRALDASIIGGADGDHGPANAIARSVCRDVERLHGAGRFAHA